jgi:hypothetical protein
MPLKNAGIIVLVVVASGCTAVRAGHISPWDPSPGGNDLWQVTHKVSGEGWAHVFDGGPVVTDSASPRAGVLGFLALDYTRPGTDGASFATSGHSSVSASDEQGTFYLDVYFYTAYGSSWLPGGDQPGGEGAGWLTSVIEFPMPGDELEWAGSLLADEPSPGFYGSASVLVENVTQSITLMELTSGSGFERTLTGRTGDVIRITTEMSGGGSAPPGYWLVRGYSPSMGMLFTVPEPGAGILLVSALFVLHRRKRS